jgi:hypothetical protein
MKNSKVQKLYKTESLDNVKVGRDQKVHVFFCSCFICSQALERYDNHVVQHMGHMLSWLKTFHLAKKKCIEGRLRASPVVLNLWSCTVKSDKEKSKICRVRWGKWFWLSIIPQFASGWWKAATTTTVWTRTKECNKFDLTAAQCFFLIGPS